MAYQILVVDDETDLELLVRQRFRKQIRDRQYEFFFSHNGEEALETLANQPDIDLVLSDINMPVMDGLTLLGKLKESGKILCAVVVSAYGDMENIRAAMNRGAGEFLTKPIDFADMEITIARCLAEIAERKSSKELHEKLQKHARRQEVEREALMLYLPPQVADMILMSGGLSQLQGMTQPITVLYADIRGFTTMSEQMDAGDIVQMLNEFFTAMSTVIFQCNGTVDKFIGDCIMALFGAPVESEQAARDALSAAIRMQRSMDTLNENRVKRGARPFHIGIGLHCGPAVVGNIGSADRVQYTAIGDTVNVAARLVGKAAATQIIVSEDIRACLPDYTGFEPLGDVELKGRAGKMRIFSTRWAEFPID